jgi:hypothetical protein
MLDAAESADKKTKSNRAVTPARRLIHGFADRVILGVLAVPSCLL